MVLRSRCVFPVVVFSLMSLAVGIGWAQGTDGSAVSPEEHARRANEYLKAKEPAKAIPELAALVGAQPENVDARANLGVLLYFQGRYAEAEEPLHAAVQMKPDLARIQALLGLCEYQLGKLDGARGDLSAVVGVLTDAKFRKEVGLTLIEVETAQQDLGAAGRDGGEAVGGLSCGRGVAVCVVPDS